MDILLYVLTGFGVGIAVGLTGVGGGSLMTPLLLLFGFPLHTAVGTDLAYAAITKSGGALMHVNQKSVDWRVAGLLWLGSLPAAGLTVVALRVFFATPDEYDRVISPALGIMLILTALSVIQRQWNERRVNSHEAPLRRQPSRSTPWLTVSFGALLGVLVTLSSVGAAAIASVFVLWLYPRLTALRILGTNLAHAVPLTLVGTLGHLFLGNVDFLLLGALVAGSLPAIFIGTRIASAIPDRVLRGTLVSTLLAAGVKFTFF